MSVRRMLKQAAGVAAHRTGAMQLVQRLNWNGVRILMYHRFPPQDRQNFDRQCAHLAGHYDVVPLAEAARRLADREPAHNLAVITVDDGYADMHEVAFPILQKHGLPATLFVTTGFIDQTCWMPSDRVRYHFAHTSRPSVQLTDEHGETHVFRTGDAAACDRLRALLKRVPHTTRVRMLGALEGGDVPPPAVANQAEYQPCTWEQLRKMAAAGIRVGAHTVTHPILSRVQARELTEWEILESKACLERELQQEVDLFAYPNGMPQDIDPVSIGCVRSHFKGAVTATAGLNVHGIDVCQLRRFPCDPGLPLPQMARMLAGPLRWREAPPPAC